MNRNTDDAKFEHIFYQVSISIITSNNFRRLDHGIQIDPRDLANSRDMRGPARISKVKVTRWVVTKVMLW